jgi:hypothetical protein
MYATILYGGITHHYMASNLNYCSRINNNNFGTIHNEYVIGLVGSKDNKVGFIKGKDSACGNIFGGIATMNMSENLDFVIGGYNANSKTFEKRGIITPSISGITPVIGLDFKIPLYEEGDFKVSIDNVVSFGIITHALSVSF